MCGYGTASDSGITAFAIACCVCEWVRFNALRYAVLASAIEWSTFSALSPTTPCDSVFNIKRVRLCECVRCLCIAAVTAAFVMQKRISHHMVVIKRAYAKETAADRETGRTRVRETRQCEFVCTCI